MTNKQRARRERKAATWAALTAAQKYEALRLACESRQPQPQAPAPKLCPCPTSEEVEPRQSARRYWNSDDGYAGKWQGVSRADVMGWDD